MHLSLLRCNPYSHTLCHCGYDKICLLSLSASICKMLPVLSKLVKSYRVLDLSKSGWGCDCIKKRYFSEMCLGLSVLRLAWCSALLRQQHGLLFRNMKCIKAGGSCAPDVCSLGRAGVLHIQRCSVSGGRLGSAASCAIPELVGLEGTLHIIQSHPPAKAGSCLGGFGMSPEREAPWCPWAACSTALWKEALPHVEMKLPAILHVSCPALPNFFSV